MYIFSSAFALMISRKSKTDEPGWGWIYISGALTRGLPTLAAMGRRERMSNKSSRSSIYLLDVGAARSRFEPSLAILS